MSARRINVDGSMVPYDQIQIADKPDLTVRVFDYHIETLGGFGRKVAKPHKVTDFGVEKETLTKNSAVFTAMLGPRWMEANKDVVSFHEDTQICTKAIEIWLRLLHKKVDRNVHCELVRRKEIWHVIQAGEKYALHIDGAKEWFNMWWEINGKISDRTTASELLFPCWIFNHVCGFGALTRYLAYNSTGYISETNPSPHRNLHLPGRVIQQLNGARAGLKTTLHQELWKPLAQVLRATCPMDCKSLTFTGHNVHLVEKGIWPLEQTYRDNTMEQLLCRLKLLKFDDSKTSPETSNEDESKSQDESSKDTTSSKSKDSDSDSDSDPDNECCKTIDLNTGSAVRATQERFHGLCLVCMDISNPVKKDEDEDYFRHHKIKKWDLRCRDSGFTHGENSWFHSFMGRRPFRERQREWRQIWRDHRDYYDSDDE